MVQVIGRGWLQVSGIGSYSCTMVYLIVIV
jgi:hypothetical protein